MTRKEGRFLFERAGLRSFDIIREKQTVGILGA